MKPSNLLKRLIVISALLLFLLAAAALLGISIGSTGNHLGTVLGILFGGQQADSVLTTIIWRIRLPRVILAFLVGATLSLGGLVFQALLRNPLAEPYILGISGGSAIGAIIGIILGFSYFPGVGIMAFTGSIATLILLLVISSGPTVLKKNSLLLSGVMVNAFCSAIIMFPNTATILPVTFDSSCFRQRRPVGRFRSGLLAHGAPSFQENQLGGVSGKFVVGEGEPAVVLA